MGQGVATPVGTGLGMPGVFVAVAVLPGGTVRVGPAVPMVGGAVGTGGGTSASSPNGAAARACRVGPSSITATKNSARPATEYTSSCLLRGVPEADFNLFPL